MGYRARGEGGGIDPLEGKHPWLPDPGRLPRSQTFARPHPPQRCRCKDGQKAAPTTPNYPCHASRRSDSATHSLASSSISMSFCVPATGYASESFM